MLIWNYEPGTGVLLGPGNADPCPLEAGQFLIPANATSITPPEFDPASQTCVFQDGSWIVADRPAPAPEPKRDLSDLARDAKHACRSAAEDILRQIYPDPVRQAALQSAAAMIGANGDSLTPGPVMKKLAELAGLYIKGSGATEVFCAVVIAIQIATIDLNIAQATAETAIASAKKAAQLKSALDAFQSSIAAIVAAINDTPLPTAVSAPGPISIPGINA